MGLLVSVIVYNRYVLHSVIPLYRPTLLPFQVLVISASNEPIYFYVYGFLLSRKPMCSLFKLKFALVIRVGSLTNTLPTVMLYLKT